MTQSDTSRPTDFDVLRLLDTHKTATAAAKSVGVAPRTFMKWAQDAKEAVETPKFKITQSNSGIDIFSIGDSIKTVNEAVAKADVDTDIWEVVETTINSWEVAGKVNQGQDGDGRWKGQSLWKRSLWQIRVKLRRKSNERMAIQALLDDIKTRGPAKRLKTTRRKKTPSENRALELCLFDPHIGLRCHKPNSDDTWSIEECEAICMWAVERMLELAKPYMPLQEIVLPFGNDYLHVDNAEGTTTRGTNQPESEQYHHIFHRGIKLGIAMVDMLAEVCPVTVLQIPGNHDSASSYALGHVLHAYYHRDDRVSVDASSEPYKFWRYGKTLIGYDHGNQIAPIRLAALMANERPHDWAETKFREWHLGDQHRKGTAKPSAMEEQGVAVEYLPSLVPANSWHKTKGFNHHQRSAMGFIYDKDHGPLARLQLSANSWLK